MHSLCNIFNVDVKLMDEQVNEIVTALVLEGNTVKEAKGLAENTITPEIVKNLEKDPEYVKLRKDQLRYAGDLADDTWFRQGEQKSGVEHPDDEFDREFLSDVKGHFEREAEFADAVADFLGDVRLKGFDKEVTKDAMKAAGDSYNHLKAAADRLRKDLNKMDVSAYDNSFYSDAAKRKVYDINKSVSRKPGKLVKDVLASLRDFLGILGLKHWEYDAFDTKYRHTPQDVKMKNINKYNPNLAMADQKEIQSVIDQAISEGIYQKEGFKVIKESLALEGDAAEYFDCYMYYCLG